MSLDRGIAGAVVTVRHDGSMLIERGLVRREDLRAAAASSPAAPGQSVEAAPPASRRAWSRSCRSTGRPPCRPSSPCGRTWRSLIVHTLTLQAFYPYGANSCLEMRTGAPRLGSAAQSAAAAALIAERERWGDHLPGAADALWAWCLEQDRNRLLDLLAVVTAPLVNAVRQKGAAFTDRLQHADQLAVALGLDMTVWYAPTAKTFFRRA